MWNSNSMTIIAVQSLSSIANINICVKTTLLLVFFFLLQISRASVFYNRHSTYGYLASVAVPLELSEHHVYMSFNFEANYGLPPSHSYHELIDRLDTDDFEMNVTKIDDRRLYRSIPSEEKSMKYSRHNFYLAVVGHLNQFGLNGSACLLRMICELAAEPLDYHNGVFGSIIKVLFTEFWPLDNDAVLEEDLLHAEWLGRQHIHGKNGKLFTEKMYMELDCCLDYRTLCRFGVLDMISNLY